MDTIPRSDGAQAFDLQQAALVRAKVDAQHVYHDPAYENQNSRSSLDFCLKALRNADALIVWKMNRPGRYIRHSVNAVPELSDRNTGFKVLLGQVTGIDTNQCRWQAGDKNLFRSGGIRVRLDL